MEWSGKPQPRVERDRWDDDWSDSSWGNSAYGSRGSYGEAYGGYSAGRNGYGEHPVSARSAWSDSPRKSYQTGHTVQEKKSTVGAGKAQVSSAPLQLKAGDLVEHTAFGRGEVLSIKPAGGDALMEVKFESGVTKKLMLKAASAYMKKL